MQLRDIPRRGRLELGLSRSMAQSRSACLWLWGFAGVCFWDWRGVSPEEVMARHCEVFEETQIGCAGLRLSRHFRARVVGSQ
jgi:hypothetical protein